MSPAATRLLPVVACVDDFGHSPAVNRAVRSLGERGLISATSCLVNMAHCDAAELRAVRASGVVAGLHLNFTEGAPLSAELRGAWTQMPSLGSLLLRAQLRALPRAAVAAECRAQLERFVALAGAPPAFIDGHQHVHHLPVIRDGWIAAAEALRLRPIVRDTSRVLGPGAALKRRVISASGGHRLRALLERRRWSAAGPLFGAYALSGGDYRPLMRGWLAELRRASSGGLLFCHPADARTDTKGTDTTGTDPIAAARAAEWSYFDSALWPADLAEAGCELARGMTVWPGVAAQA